MKKTLAALIVLSCLSPLFAGQIKLSGKAGLSYWYEDYERKGFGGICWLNEGIGIEVLFNIDTTLMHDAGGYGGKIRFPLVLKSDDSIMLEILPTLFYRYDNTRPTISSITSLSPGLWAAVELFPLEKAPNISLGIAAGLDYTMETSVLPAGGKVDRTYWNISIFSLGVRYYF